MLMNAFCINRYISLGLVPDQHPHLVGHIGKSVTQLSFVGCMSLTYNIVQKDTITIMAKQ